MTPAEAKELRVGDPVKVDLVVARPAGHAPEIGYAIVRVAGQFDGAVLPIRWASGIQETIGAHQLSAVHRATEPILGLDRDVVAFAAGIHAAGCRNWQVVAVTIETLGLGQRDPAHLANAVDLWTREIARKADTSKEAFEAARNRVKARTLH